MPFDFMIELYAIEKDEEVQNSLIKPISSLNATGVGMDSESLPIASHLTFPPQAFNRRDGLLSGSDPFLQLAVNQGNQREMGWECSFIKLEAAFELMTGKVFPTESVWEALTTEYHQFVCD